MQVYNLGILVNSEVDGKNLNLRQEDGRFMVGNITASHEIEITDLEKVARFKAPLLHQNANFMREN